MDSTSVAISAQVAAKAAAEITVALVGNGLPVEGVSDAYLAVMETVHSDLVDRITTFSPAVVTPPAPAVAPAPAPAVAPAVAPALALAPNPATSALRPGETPSDPGVAALQAAIPGAQVVQGITPNSSREEMWNDAINSRLDWKIWDSPKSSMNGGKNVDVQHETVKNDSGYALGFWLISDKDPAKSAPRWVWQGLGLDAKWQENLAVGRVLAE